MFFLMPRTAAERNVTASINSVSLGDDGENKHIYRIKTPVISLNTYREIVNIAVGSGNKKKDNNNNTSFDFKYFKLSKQTGDLKKSDIKNIVNFALSICPACQYSNCLYCGKRAKFRKYMKKYTEIFKEKKRNYPKFMRCFYCGNIFRTRYTEIDYDNYRSIPFPSCAGWQCVDCKCAYDNPYSEFLNYLTHSKRQRQNNTANHHHKSDTTTTTTALKTRLGVIYNSLSDEARDEIGNDNSSFFYYSFYVDDDNGTLIPPLAFFIDTNKPAAFYEKLLHLSPSDVLDIKTKYGSVNTRSQGGKNCIFRSHGLNKRYVESGRLVIVPRRQLQPHQCLLPDILYRRLNCPKHIIGHRYPTLDIRSMAYLEVVGVWQYPCLAISTAIVYGMHGDFDGDCLHVIPAHNFSSQAELVHLAHPKYNMIVQKQLRVKFDHDEVQTIYSEFGLDSNEIHNAIHALVKEKSSPFAYGVFCNLRNYCHWVWENKSIPTITFGDFNEIQRLFNEEKKEQDTDYLTFLNRIFPAVKPHNGMKEIINAKSSRFSVDHLWQIFGEINADARTGFLRGLTKEAFIKMAIISRNAMVKDVGYLGYNHIKLAHCTKTFTVGHDGYVYTSDGILVARNIEDVY